MSAKVPRQCILYERIATKLIQNIYLIPSTVTAVISLYDDIDVMSPAPL